MKASKPQHLNRQTTDSTSQGHGDGETSVNGDDSCSNSVMKNGIHSSGTRIFTREPGFLNRNKFHLREQEMGNVADGCQSMPRADL